MDHKEAIKEAESQVDMYEAFILYNKDFEPKNDNRSYEYKIDFLKTAISAMRELQLYKDGKLCLIPESVYYKQCAELDAYKQLGTLEEAREALEKAEKYHWHNLRKNPEDLPELRVECEVALKRTYSDYRMNGHARRLELSDGIYWYEEHYGFVQHPKCNNGCGGDNTIEVIAWREIEPFESEVKE